VNDETKKSGPPNFIDMIDQLLNKVDPAQFVTLIEKLRCANTQGHADTHKCARTCVRSLIHHACILSAEWKECGCKLMSCWYSSALPPPGQAVLEPFLVILKQVRHAPSCLALYISGP